MSKLMEEIKGESRETGSEATTDGGKKHPAWWARLGAKERKLVLRLCGVLLLGLALMYGSGWLSGGSGGSLFSGHESTQQSPSLTRAPEAAITVAEEDLEAKLLRILSAVEGAGKVQVALSFSESATAEYAVNSDISESSDEEADDKGATSSGNQKSESRQLAEINSAPILIKESMPLLNGAVIVAEGAGDPYVREKLLKAARVLLGLPAHRIEVLKSE